MPVVVYCRGTAGTANESLWTMKGNLQNDQMVYWHHFNEKEEMAWKVEAAFPNVVFGVAPAILRSMLLWERRATSHPWVAGTVLKRVTAIKGVPLPITGKICESSFRRLFGHAK